MFLAHSAISAGRLKWFLMSIGSLPVIMICPVVEGFPPDEELPWRF